MHTSLVSFLNDTHTYKLAYIFSSASLLSSNCIPVPYKTALTVLLIVTISLFALVSAPVFIHSMAVL